MRKLLTPARTATPELPAGGTKPSSCGASIPPSVPERRTGADQRSRRPLSRSEKYEVVSRRALAFLRIMAALLLMRYGFVDLLSGPATSVAAQGLMSSAHTQLGAGLGEVIAGGLLAIGLLTRLTALISSCAMVITFYAVYAPAGFWPGIDHGSLTILLAFVFLQLSVAGPGAWSVDGLVEGRA